MVIIGILITESNNCSSILSITMIRMIVVVVVVIIVFVVAILPDARAVVAVIIEVISTEGNVFLAEWKRNDSKCETQRCTEENVLSCGRVGESE